MRITFMMEQHIGHRTFYLNLRRHIAVDRRIEPRWVEVSYYQENGWLERSRLVPMAWRGSLRGLLQVRAGLAAARADALFFNTAAPAAFLFDQMRTRPVVLCTDITPLQYDAMAEVYGRANSRFGLLKALKHRLDRAVFRRAAHVIAWSNWVRDSLLRDYGLPAAKVSVIPPGVDLEAWQPDPARPEAFNGPVKLLFVGGDFTRKGGRVLLDALKLLDPASFEPHLVTREAVPHLPGMHIYHGLTPNSAELIRLYRHCDLFVLPTFGEAFGIAALEALATGLPVIASRMGGLTDVVDDGVNGVLVPAGDPQALAQTIAQLAADPARLAEMRRSARRAAEERFDAKRNAQQVVSLLLEKTGGAYA